MIQTGYKEWIEEPKRQASAEVDFGVWWKLSPGHSPAIPNFFHLGTEPVLVFSAESAGRWRVSWIQDAGELYARHLAPNSDYFIVLGHYNTDEVNSM